MNANACHKLCTRMLQPICARLIGSVDAEKQSFQNVCLMENYNCDNPSRMLEKVADGECVLGPVKFQ